MTAPKQPQKRTAIRLGPSSSVHLKDIRVSGYDTFLDAHPTSSAKLDNVVVKQPTQLKSNLRHKMAAAKVGWTPNTKAVFDAKGAAELAERCGGGNPFDDPKLLLDEAREHIEKLDRRADAFFASKPYACVIEIDRDADQQVHKVRLTQPLPAKAAIAAKDAITNLRDALDHAVYASSVAVRGGGNVIGKTAFPFAGDAAAVHGKLNIELLGVPPEIRSYLEALQPHAAGNPLLWGLNAARNVETHKIIVPLATATIGSSLKINGVVSGATGIGLSQWDAAKNEAEFLRIGTGTTVNYKLDVAFCVLFGDAAGLGGEHALDTLYMCLGEVEGIVLALESETARTLRNANR